MSRIRQRSMFQGSMDIRITRYWKNSRGQPKARSIGEDTFCLAASSLNAASAGPASLTRLVCARSKTNHQVFFAYSMNAFRLPLDGDHHVTRLNRCIDFFAFGQIKAILIYKRTLGKAGTATVHGFVRRNSFGE